MKSKNKTMTELKNIIKTTSCFLLVISTASQAEERTGLLLNGDVSAEYSDNVLNNSKNISDTAIILNPKVRYLAPIGKHDFIFSYRGEFTNYLKDSNLNYNAQKLGARLLLDHSNKINTEFSLGYDKINEAPGSTNSSTQDLTEFNQYSDKSALAKFYYGQRKSLGQFVFDYKYVNRSYLNNNQSYRDVEQNQFSATFYYRVAPKTRLLFQAVNENYDYEDRIFTSGKIFNQSNTNNLFLTGVEWQATAKSSGTFKIGYRDKDYDDVMFNDTSGLSYTLDMLWKPNTFTRLNLMASRQGSESAELNEAGFIKTTYSLAASHDITARTLVNAKYTFNNNDIISDSGRSDKRHTLKLGFNHSLRKWLNIKLAYKYQEKSSTLERFNFKSNTISISLETLFI